MSRPIPLLTEKEPQHQVLNAIFREWIDAGIVRVDACYSRDSALAELESSLLENPDRFFAAAFETRTDDPWKISELDLAVHRRVRKFIPMQNKWHVAWAVPNLKAWALIDDHIRQEYEMIHQDSRSVPNPEEREEIERSNYLSLASRIGDWVAVQPFDLEALKRKSRQVRDLCEFIEKSFHYVPEPVPVTAEDWF